MTRTVDTLPGTLRQFCVSHDVQKYTARDHAAWRYIMRRAVNFFRKNAVAGYEAGLRKTGLSTERIPSIYEIDLALQKFGWGAVPVCGFIPPWAFLEFQARRILPIASDMRSVDHIAYTPAPDIVHEAAGHAPILPDRDYSDYLNRYATLSTKAIYSRQDLELYEAIRYLSDIKERPESKASEIEAAEQNLADTVARCNYVSESTKVTRMNWWTAEYGLAGPLNNPKIYGAGLLSSVGESENCLTPQVKKIPLSLACVEMSYDITRPQPQLFVAEDMQHLKQVLTELDDTLAYRRGGVYGLELAHESGAITTTILDTGLGISGRLMDFQVDAGEGLEFLKFEGPVQLSYGGSELPNHGTARHPQGFSSPFGRWVGAKTKDPSRLSEAELSELGLTVGEKCRLEFVSGFVVAGTLEQVARQDGRILYLTWRDCRVTKGDQLYFDPSWGAFDMAVGLHAPSVHGGPSDRESFGVAEGGQASSSPARQTPYSDQEKALFAAYGDVRRMREDSTQNRTQDLQTLEQRAKELLAGHPEEWLALLEIYELGLLKFHLKANETPWFKAVEEHLKDGHGFDAERQDLIRHGLVLLETV